MFEFEGNRDNPARLMEILERFTRWWLHNDDPETGVSKERLAKVSLPMPLERLYAFAGEWMGGRLDSIFSNQDFLLPFEALEVDDGKLVFAFENQGEWRAATELTGQDPPVWLSIEEGPWKCRSESLAQFLVTFCLKELVYGPELGACSSLEDIQDVIRKSGKLSIPLWSGPSIETARSKRKEKFSVIDGCILVRDNWCGARSPEIMENYPEFFPSGRNQRGPGMTRDEAMASPAVPRMIRITGLQALIAKHEQRAQDHQAKVSVYREMLERAQAEPWT